ncbi:MAG: hypothetical protein ACE5Z5_11790 [Candidatus Bathyarchaeia archaeon]
MGMEKIRKLVNEMDEDTELAFIEEIVKKRINKLKKKDEEW